MRMAVIDISAGLLSSCSTILNDHGLKFAGSLNNEPECDHVIRLVIEDEFDRLLPEQCQHGIAHFHKPLCMVRMTFQQEMYGTQKLTKVALIEVVGELIVAPNGATKVKRAA